MIRIPTKFLTEEDDADDIGATGAWLNIDRWYQQCQCHWKALVMMMDWAKAGKPHSADKLLLCHNQLTEGAVTSISFDGESCTAFESRCRNRDEVVYDDQFLYPVNPEERIAKILDAMNAKFGTVHPVEWSCDV